MGMLLLWEPYVQYIFLVHVGILELTLIAIMNFAYIT